MNYTVQVPTKSDNDTAPAPGARPIQQHESAARRSYSQSQYHQFDIAISLIRIVDIALYE